MCESEELIVESLKTGIGCSYDQLGTNASDAVEDLLRYKNTYIIPELITELGFSEKLEKGCM